MNTKMLGKRTKVALTATLLLAMLLVGMSGAMATGPAVSIYIPSASGTVAPGGSVVFTVNVTNIGTVNGTWRFLASGYPVGYTAVWSQASAEIKPNEGVNVTLTISAPSNAQKGVSFTVSVEAYLEINRAISAADSLTVSVSQTYGVTMTPASYTGIIDTTKTGEFAFAVQNTGNGADTVTITMDSVGGAPTSWTYGFASSVGGTQTSTLTLSFPQPPLLPQTKNFWLYITIPASALTGQSYVFTVKAASSSVGVSDTSTVTPTVGTQVLGVDIVSVVPPTNTALQPGTSADWTINVKNTGLVTETINMKWKAVGKLYVGGALVDYVWDSSEALPAPAESTWKIQFVGLSAGNTLSVDAGVTQAVTLRITAPTVAVAAQSLTVYITANVMTDRAISDSASLNLTSGTGFGAAPAAPFEIGTLGWIIIGVVVVIIIVAAIATATGAGGASAAGKTLSSRRRRFD